MRAYPRSQLVAVGFTYARQFQLNVVALAFSLTRQMLSAGLLPAQRYDIAGSICEES